MFFEAENNALDLKDGQKRVKHILLEHFLEWQDKKFEEGYSELLTRFGFVTKLVPQPH